MELEEKEEEKSALTAVFKKLLLLRHQCLVVQKRITYVCVKSQCTHSTILWKWGRPRFPPYEDFSVDVV